MTNLNDQDLDPLPWNERSSSMPTLPGKSDHWLEHLTALLSELSNGEVHQLTESLSLGFTERPISLAQYADKTVPSGLALRKRRSETLHASPAAIWWLQQQNPLNLVLLLHRNVRFVGELLALMERGPITLTVALTCANVGYELGWNTVGALRERLKWLELLGAARHVHDHQWILTPAGRELLPMLKLAPNANGDEAGRSPEATRITPAGPVIASRLAQVRDSHQSGLRRRGSLGYIPTGEAHSPVGVIREIAGASADSITKDEFIALCATKYDTSKSSAVSALSSLRTAGILQPVDLDVFATTEPALEWLASDDDLNLIRLLHTRLIFVGELLSLVGTHSRAPELHRIGREQYGVRAKESASTASMLRLMKHVGLVRPTGWAQFARTSTGTLLADELTSEVGAPLTDTVTTHDHKTTSPLEDYAELRQELRAASFDSKDHRRFEAALTSAFRALGLDASHIGSSGDTDVLVNIGFGAATYGHAVVDAKSSSLGQIHESTISLDAIDDHRKAHACAYAAVVAPGYASERLREWASERNIALLTVDELDLVMERHYRTPLQPGELVELFKPHGAESINSRFAEKRRWLDLITAVVDCFVRQTHEDDPVIGTALDTKLLYWEMRDKVDQRPTTMELEQLLEFLAAPLVDMLARTKSGYVLRESPETTARRLDGLAAAISTGPINVSPEALMLDSARGA